MKVLDTFAGAGGFSLGFEQTGEFEIIGAIESDAWAAETFKFNHKTSKVLLGDIREFTEEQLLAEFPVKPDIILGGPPCQGFSIANRKQGDPSDPRNSLFKEFVRMGAIFKPSVMVMENVPNLVKAKTHNKEFVIDIIQDELEKLGYFVKYKILNATDYGVPQIRRRLIVIASKSYIDNPFPTPTHSIDTDRDLVDSSLLKCPTLWDAISDLPEIHAREGEEIMEYTLPIANDYQRKLRTGADKVYNHTSMKHSKRMIERFSSMEWGHSVADVPDHLKPIKRNTNGIISENPYDQNNRRMFPYKPCHTIAASFYANFVHPFKHRNFTPREGARIQSFPDSYIFKGKPTVVSHKLLHREGREEDKHLGQYNQIGNAVPPMLSNALAINLLKQITYITQVQECSFTETI